MEEKCKVINMFTESSVGCPGCERSCRIGRRTSSHLQKQGKALGRDSLLGIAFMVIISNFKFMVLVTFSLLSANYSKSGHCHTQLML